MLRKIAWMSVVALVANVSLAWAEPPVVTAAKFDAFARAYFTAVAEPDMWKTFGSDFKFVTTPESNWRRASTTSAVVAFETNLPAKSYVLYGMLPGAYAYATPVETRSTFIHVQYLRYLQPGTTYYYKIFTFDDRGLLIMSDESSFQTTAVVRGKVIEVPGTLQGPPYLLDQEGATYVVTRDIVADSTAFNITKSGITLDLGGNTVIYNNKAGVADPNANEAFYGPQGAGGPCGIRTADGLKGVKIFNGKVEQGAGMGVSKFNGYYPIFLRRPMGLEMAGVTVTYAGGQVSGVKVNNGGDGLDLHHNVVYDQGTVLFDRHHGSHAFEVDTSKAAATVTKVHHNLVLRARHCGITASEKQEIYSNEIYVDSYATNSYGIQYTSLTTAEKLAIHNNKVFGTGFHPIGIGAGQGWSDVQVFENFVLMQGTTFEWRWAGGEGGGDADAADKSGVFPLNGIRLQKPRENVRHSGNTVIVKGFGVGCNMRGLWLMPDSGSPSSVTFMNNRVKVVSMDGVASGSAVDAGGCGLQAGKPHVSLEGNTIESNLCNVQFGDHYGHGGPYIFTRNTLVQLGADPRYKTIRVGWGGAAWDSFDHQFADTAFQGGASFDKISWDGASSKKYEFTVAWTLTVQTDPGAMVTIKNNAGKTVAAYAADAKGLYQAVVTQGTFSSAGNRMDTPHTVVVSKGMAKPVEKTVVVDRAQTVLIGL